MANKTPAVEAPAVEAPAVEAPAVDTVETVTPVSTLTDVLNACITFEQHVQLSDVQFKSQIIAKIAEAKHYLSLQ